MVRVHLAGKHAAKFHLFNPRGEFVKVGNNFFHGFDVVFLLRHIEQQLDIVHSRTDGFYRPDRFFKQRPFLAQRLGAFRFTPDIRLFKFPPDCIQAFDLDIEVKDTSSGIRFFPGSL